MSKTALVIDDSVSMRQMVAFTLREAGYEVLEGGNGQEGLNTLNEGRRVDLIITDLNMPVLDGIGFIRQARALPVTRFTPILMLTTESQEARKLEGKAAGATGWLVKPFDPEKLLQVVTKVVR
jgi:two-component system, chemotaxis family, chemotaxis protein CheY